MSRLSARRIPPTLALALLAGCDRDHADGLLQLDDTANYHFDAALDIGITPVAAGQDALVDWSGLHTDLLGHPVDPARDVVQLTLAMIPRLSYEEAAEGLVQGTLLSEDIGGSFFLTSEGRTSARLSDFRFQEQEMIPEDYLLEGEGIWIVAVQEATAGGALMVRWIEPLAASDGSAVTVDDTSATLSFSATFAEPLRTSATGPWSADWTELGTTGGGVDVSRAVIDGVWIARYDAWSPDELAEHYLDAELEADAIFSSWISGTTTLDDLGALRNDDGEHFPGFSADSTWMLALRCSTCTTPAPPFAAVVEVGS